MQSVSREEVWRHRRVTLTESRPSGSIAAGQRKPGKKVFFLLRYAEKFTDKDGNLVQLYLESEIHGRGIQNPRLSRLS